MRSRRVTALGLMGLITVSCEAPTATVSPSGRANVTVTNVQRTDMESGAHLSLAVSVQNTGLVPVYWHPCSIALERRRDSQDWDHVWSQLCTLAAPADPLLHAVEIPAGRMRETTVVIVAQEGGLHWEAVQPGHEYRFRALLTDRQLRLLPPLMLVSAAFELLENATLQQDR